MPKLFKQVAPNTYVETQPISPSARDKMMADFLANLRTKSNDLNLSINDTPLMDAAGLEYFPHTEANFAKNVVAHAYDANNYFVPVPNARPQVGLSFDSSYLDSKLTVFAICSPKAPLTKVIDALFYNAAIQYQALIANSKLSKENTNADGFIISARASLVDRTTPDRPTTLPLDTLNRLECGLKSVTYTSSIPRPMPTDCELKDIPVVVPKTVPTFRIDYNFRMLFI